jgi:AraC-like DNA-binding protein
MQPLSPLRSTPPDPAPSPIWASLDHQAAGVDLPVGASAYPEITDGAGTTALTAAGDPPWIDQVRRHFDPAVQVTLLAPPRTGHCNRLDSIEFAGAKMTLVRTGQLSSWRARPAVSNRFQPMALIQLSGSLAFHQFDREVALSAGMFTFLDAAQPYRIEAQTDSERLYMRFPPPTFVPRHFRNAAARAGSDKIFADYVVNLWRVVRELRFDQHAAALGGAVAVSALTAPFQNAEEAEAIDRRVRRAREFIECRLGDESLSAEIVADSEGLSRRYLDQLFSKATGHSVAAWIWERRLTRAEEQFRLADFRGQSLLQVALDVGFKSPSHFSRSFAKRFGIAPKEYRKQRASAT